VRLAKLHTLLTGAPSLLDPAASGERPMWVHPAFDQQRMDNMERVMARLRGWGCLPSQGQVCVLLFFLEPFNKVVRVGRRARCACFLFFS